MPFPNKATQFPVNRKDHTQRGPYFKSAFDKLLKNKFPMQDPNGKLMKMQGGNGIALAMIWEALRGDVNAAREVMDRTDGKVLQKTEFSGTVNMLPVTKIRGKKAEYDIG